MDAEHKRISDPIDVNQPASAFIRRLQQFVEVVAE